MASAIPMTRKVRKIGSVRLIEQSSTAWIPTGDDERLGGPPSFYHREAARSHGSGHARVGEAQFRPSWLPERDGKGHRAQDGRAPGLACV